jgi:hypothetical protein
LPNTRDSFANIADFFSFSIAKPSPAVSWTIATDPESVPGVCLGSFANYTKMPIKKFTGFYSSWDYSSIQNLKSKITRARRESFLVSFFHYCQVPYAWRLLRAKMCISDYLGALGAQFEVACRTPMDSPNYPNGFRKLARGIGVCGFDLPSSSSGK